MPRLNELIYNIKNLKGGEHTDDFKPTSRQVEFILDHFRAEIASQRINSNKSTEGFWQTLTNLKLVSSKDYIPKHSCAKVLRSKDKIPKLATFHRGYMVDYVGTRDEFLGFYPSAVHSFNLDLEDPYTTDVYFITGGYLYVVTKNRNMLREVYFKAMFNSPREVMEFEGDLDRTSGDNWQYPIPGNLVGQLNNLVINNEFRWSALIPPDLKNDGKDA